jgi:hypothetical protein
VVFWVVTPFSDMVGYHFQGDEIKEDDMDGTRNVRVGREKHMQHFDRKPTSEETT